MRFLLQILWVCACFVATCYLKKSVFVSITASIQKLLTRRSSSIEEISIMFLLFLSLICSKTKLVLRGLRLTLKSHGPLHIIWLSPWTLGEHHQCTSCTITIIKMPEGQDRQFQCRIDQIQVSHVKGLWVKVQRCSLY